MSDVQTQKICMVIRKDSNILSLLRIYKESSKRLPKMFKFESLKNRNDENDITSLTIGESKNKAWEWQQHFKDFGCIHNWVNSSSGMASINYGLDKIFILLISSSGRLTWLFWWTLFFFKHKFDKQKQKLENILLRFRKILLSSHEKNFSIETDEIKNNISTINQSKIKS